jgi:predicted ArsR family transcriptional regulator
MDGDDFDARIQGISALEHPLSRQVYRTVLGTGEVGRDELAGALGIPRSVAAFHLDKLADAGLLASRFERVSGRTGPGAGRPAKLYRRAEREIELSLPPRRYDLAAAMLADAVSRAGGAPGDLTSALATAARERGEQIAQQFRAGRVSRRDALPVVLTILEEHGYEPRRTGTAVAMLNCPFHHLAEEHRALVCGMNHDFLTGVIHGAGAGDSLRARLAPEAGFCCVRVERSSEP